MTVEVGAQAAHDAVISHTVDHRKSDEEILERLSFLVEGMERREKSLEEEGSEIIRGAKAMSDGIAEYDRGFKAAELNAACFERGVDNEETDEVKARRLLRELTPASSAQREQLEQRIRGIHDDEEALQRKLQLEVEEPRHEISKSAHHTKRHAIFPHEKKVFLVSTVAGAFIFVGSFLLDADDALKSFFGLVPNAEYIGGSLLFGGIAGFAARAVIIAGNNTTNLVERYRNWQNERKMRNEKRIIRTARRLRQNGKSRLSRERITAALRNTFSFSH